MNRTTTLAITIALLLIACTTTEQILPEGCPLDRYELRGDSLAGLLEEGTIITATNTSCKEIKRDSLVLYEHPGRDNPIIKVVKGLPGDELELRKEQILVNNETLTISTGEPYNLTGNRAAMIRLYEGTIQNNNYLLLGNQIRGSLDSTRYGLAHKEQIIGVVIN